MCPVLLQHDWSKCQHAHLNEKVAATAVVPATAPVTPLATLQNTVGPQLTTVSNARPDVRGAAAAILELAANWRARKAAQQAQFQGQHAAAPAAPLVISLAIPVGATGLPGITAAAAASMAATPAASVAKSVATAAAANCCSLPVPFVDMARTRSLLAGPLERAPATCSGAPLVTASTCCMLLTAGAVSAVRAASLSLQDAPTAPAAVAAIGPDAAGVSWPRQQSTAAAAAASPAPPVGLGTSAAAAATCGSSPVQQSTSFQAEQLQQCKVADVSMMHLETVSSSSAVAKSLYQRHNASSLQLHAHRPSTHTRSVGPPAQPVPSPPPAAAGVVDPEDHHGRSCDMARGQTAEDCEPAYASLQHQQQQQRQQMQSTTPTERCPGLKQHPQHLRFHPALLKREQQQQQRRLVAVAAVHTDKASSKVGLSDTQHGVRAAVDDQSHSHLPAQLLFLPQYAHLRTAGSGLSSQQTVLAAAAVAAAAGPPVGSQNGAGNMANADVLRQGKPVHLHDEDHDDSD